jgi:diacylglycerol kinase
MPQFVKTISSSFINAFKGIVQNIRSERNFKIQLSLAILTVVAAFFFNIKKGEWIAVIILIGAVLSAEAINTSIEKVCDRFLKEEDPTVKIIKDSAAAPVLILSIAAFIVGVIIFWPYVKELFD